MVELPGGFGRAEKATSAPPLPAAKSPSSVPIPGHRWVAPVNVSLHWGTARQGAGESSCDACRKISTKVVAIDAAPELPLAECANEMGCCCYVAAANSG